MARINRALVDSGTALTSFDLNEGGLYSREDLKVAYRINDTTLNTGVYLPPGKRSIWLFVTEHKTPDKTQYVDHFEGSDLVWQGQTSGRTDRAIKEHEQDGRELLVFFRKHKAEYDGFAFKYMGPFKCTSYSGAGPTTFRLTRAK